MFSLALAKKDKITIYDCKQILSYLGWIDCTNTYDMYFNHIKPWVDFRYYRNRVSKYDKRLSKWRKKEYEIRIQELFIKRGAGNLGQHIIS